MTYRTEQIEDAIENTRSRIDSRLDQMGDTFSPAGFLSNLLGEDGQPASNIGASLVNKARENPFSALLVGAGLAGFFMAGRARSNGQQDVHPQRPLGETHVDPIVSGDPAERVGQRVHDLKNQAEGIRDGVADSVEDLNRAAKDGMDLARSAVRSSFDDVSDKVTDMAGKTADAVNQTSSQAKERGRDYADRLHSKANAAGRAVRKQADRSRDGVETAANWVKDNPIPAGLMALAAGAAAASILAAKRPVTGQAKNTQSGAHSSGEDTANEQSNASARQRQAEPEPKVGDRVVDLQAEAEVSGAANGAKRDLKAAAEKFPGAAKVLNDPAKATGKKSAPAKPRSAKKISTLPKGVSSKPVGAD
ncbi:MAG: hypothetical protein P1V21_06570 [Rhizobiaceae bacterium]|nr:hypothetical protein [Rhizobiaceae bacterium]